MSKLSHSNPALDDCLGHISQCDIAYETQRAMCQALKISALSPEELEERREQFLRENYEERERSDYEEHNTHWGKP